MFKTLPKIALFALIMCFVFLSGCSSYNYSIEGGPSASDAVSNNGSMAVKKGDFLFFINGVSSTTAKNDFGTPVKGSIVRKNLTTDEEPVIAVPKVALSSYDKGGIYIFDDRIYYPSPSTEKDKKGNRLSSYLDFYSTKINGSDTKKIITITNNTVPYKFYQSGEKVCLLYIDSATSKIYNVDCKSGARKTVLENYSGTPIMADDGYIYYNEIIYKDDTKTSTYTYNLFKRVSFDGTGAEEIKFSGGKTITDSAFNVTLNNVKIIDGKTVLFYSKKSATDINQPITLPDAYIFSYIVGEAADKLLLPNKSGQFEYTNLNYLTATSVLGVYSEKLYYLEHNQENPELPNQTVLMNNPAKIITTDGDYIYYLKTISADNILHKKQFKGEGIVPNTEGEIVMEEVSVSMSGLSPFILSQGEIKYFYFLRANGDYINYLYRFNISGGSSAEAELTGILADEDKKE